MAHLKTTTAGEHKRVLRSFLHSPNGSRYHFKSMLTPCGEHVLVRVYDLNAPTFIYDETNVRKQHLTSFFMHNFDMHNEEEKQVKAQEKLKGIKRPHQLNNEREGMMRNEGVSGRTNSRFRAEAMPLVGGVEGPASAGRGRAMWVSRVRAAHLWWCVTKTPVPMNSMARETPWLDDRAVVPAFGGPAELREAV